jgi:integrase
MTGSLPIDLQFRGIGRLHLRSGTTKRQTRDAMRAMLRTLYQVGRQDVLRDLKANRITVMQVWEQYRQGKLNEIPTGELVRALATAWAEWLEQKEIAARTRRDYGEAWTRLGAGGGATFVDLPGLLQTHRKGCLGVRARTFNKDRAAILAFVHSILGDTHWLALACRRVAPLKVAKERRLPFHPLTVEQAKALAARLAPHHARTLWLLCLTGMRPEEAFEEIGNRWAVEPDGIRIHGTKSAAAERIVPRVGLLVKPSTKRQAFYQALRAASTRRVVAGGEVVAGPPATTYPKSPQGDKRGGGRVARVSGVGCTPWDGETVTPYDLRRTYSQWLDLARIPQFRQSYYLGHGPKNLDQLYQRMRASSEYLREDAAALEQLVGESVAVRLVK